MLKMAQITYFFLNLDFKNGHQVSLNAKKCKEISDKSLNAKKCNEISDRSLNAKKCNVISDMVSYKSQLSASIKKKNSINCYISYTLI